MVDRRGGGANGNRLFRPVRSYSETARVKLEVIILGCGSSAGVPRADGDWGACDPAEPRNRRSRCSLMVRRRSAAGPEGETTLIVDAAPEFRLQASAANV